MHARLHVLDAPVVRDALVPVVPIVVLNSVLHVVQVVVVTVKVNVLHYARANVLVVLAVAKIPVAINAQANAEMIVRMIALELVQELILK